MSQLLLLELMRTQDRWLGSALQLPAFLRYFCLANVRFEDCELAAKFSEMFSVWFISFRKGLFPLYRYRCIYRP